MLRKIVAIMIVTCLMSGAALAQPRAVVFSVKGGINLANLNLENSDAAEPDNLLGLTGGVTLSTPINPGLGIDLDVLYVQKGASQSYTSGMSGEVEFETQLDYLVFGPMLRLAPGHHGAGIYFLMGAELGYLLNAESRISSDDSSADMDIKDHYKDFDLGVTFGLGFQSSTSRASAFFCEARYALGLADVGDMEDDGSGSDTSPSGVKTRGIYALAGFRF